MKLTASRAVLREEKFVIADADGNNKLEGEELVQMYGHGMSDKVGANSFCSWNDESAIYDCVSEPFLRSGTVFLFVFPFPKLPQSSKEQHEAY